MRLLHTADWHLGKYLNEFSLLDDQKHMLFKMGEIIKEKNIDAVIIAGDIYHRSIPPAEAVELLDNTLNIWINEYKVRVLLIAGNHDSPERLSFGSKLYEGSGLHVQGMQEKSIRKVELSDEHGEIVFHLLPYIEPIKMRTVLEDDKVKTYQHAYEKLLALEENKIDKSKRNIMVAHSFFTGKSGEYVSSDTERNVGGSDMVSSEVFKDYDYVALGHLHAPQKAGADNIRYSGSLLKYSLSEVGQKKGFYIIDVNEKGSINIERTSIEPKRDIRILEGSLETILSKSREDINKQDYVFAKLSDNIVYEGMSKLRAMYPNIIGLSLNTDNYEKGINSVSSVELKNSSITELFEKFYFDITGEDISKKEADVIESISKIVEREE